MTAIHRVCALGLATCMSAALSVAPATARTVRHAGVQGMTPAQAQPIATATLTQCVTTGTERTGTEGTGSENERSLMIAATMTLIPASSRMQTRTYLVQRRGGEAQFHMIAAPGLGAWLEAEPGVKTYKDLRQVTNLAAPAVYRAVVDFRWLNAHGHVVKRMQLNTSKCVQPAPTSSSPPDVLSPQPAQGLA